MPVEALVELLVEPGGRHSRRRLLAGWDRHARTLAASRSAPGWCSAVTAVVSAPFRA